MKKKIANLEKNLLSLLPFENLKKTCQKRSELVGRILFIHRIYSDLPKIMMPDTEEEYARFEDKYSAFLYLHFESLSIFKTSLLLACMGNYNCAFSLLRGGTELHMKSIFLNYLSHNFRSDLKIKDCKEIIQLQKKYKHDKEKISKLKRNSILLLNLLTENSIEDFRIKTKDMLLQLGAWRLLKPIESPKEYIYEKSPFGAN